MNKEMALGQNVGVKSLSSALRVVGADCSRFLNGLLSQDFKKATEENFRVGGRTFLLTPKAKIISPAYFSTISENEVVLWTHKKSFPGFFENLSKYLVADKVELIPLGDFESWSLVESSFPVEAIKARHPEGKEMLFRCPEVDSFLFAPQAKLSPTHTELLCLKKSFEATELSQEDYWLAHFQSGQPQWLVDYHEDDFFLEFPFQDAVSFDKGCYRGQETVARGTFRGKVNKSFARIFSENLLSKGELLNAQGEKMGDIRSTQANKALGIMKFSEQINLDGVKVEWLVNETSYRGMR